MGGKEAARAWGSDRLAGVQPAQAAQSLRMWLVRAAASYAYSLHAAPNDLAPDGRLHSSYTSAFFAKVKRAELHKVVQQPWPLRVLHRLQSMDRPS